MFSVFHKVVCRVEDPPGANHKHIYVEGDKPFTIEIGNEPFLSTDEMPLLNHINLSRAELIKGANELYDQKTHTTTTPS